MFFQHYWNIIGPSVTAWDLSILNDGHSIEEVNTTFITLIPKCAQPSQLVHFRPIALCNVLYKIVSKVIANRLKGALQNIISPEQGDFLKGWVLSDNFILASEVFHFLGSKDYNPGSLARAKIGHY